MQDELAMQQGDLTKSDDDLVNVNHMLQLDIENYEVQLSDANRTQSLTLLDLEDKQNEIEAYAELVDEYETTIANLKLQVYHQYYN